LAKKICYRKKKNGIIHPPYTNTYQNDALPLKIITLGKKEIGKTCLVARCTDDVYPIKNDIVYMLDFKIKTQTIEGLRIKTYMWRPHYLTSRKTLIFSYFRLPKGVILCYDITDRESFIEVEQALYRFKLQQNVNLADDRKPKYVLVGLKLDLVNNRSLTYEEANNWAKKHGMSYYEVSSLTGENVKQFFNEFISEIVNTMYYTILGDPIEIPESLFKEDKKSYTHFSSYLTLQ